MSTGNSGSQTCQCFINKRSTGGCGKKSKNNYMTQQNMGGQTMKGNDCTVCPSPPGLNGGSRDVSGKTDGRLYVGSVVRNSCNKGYLSEGPVEIKCIRDKGNIKWSHDINAFQCDKIPDEFASRYVPQ